MTREGKYGMVYEGKRIISYDRCRLLYSKSPLYIARQTDKTENQETSSNPISSSSRTPLDLDDPIVVMDINGKLPDSTIIPMLVGNITRHLINSYCICVLLSIDTLILIC